MAVQTINYLNAPRAGFEDITNGFNAAYGPTAAKRKAEANALAAEFLKLQIQHEPQKYESERAYKQSLTDAQNQKINLFSQLLGGNQASGNMSGQTQPGQFMLDPGTIEELLRVELGLGPESPEKAKQRAIDTHIQNTINTKKIEQQFPTPAVLTKDQEKIQGIEGLIPLLNKIIENPVPSQAEIPLPEFLGENTGISNIPGVSQIFNWGKSGPNENAAYHGRAGLAKDVALKSQGLSSTTENLKTIGHAIERQSGESEDA